MFARIDVIYHEPCELMKNVRMKCIRTGNCGNVVFSYRTNNVARQFPNRAIIFVRTARFNKMIFPFEYIASEKLKASSYLSR